MCTMVSLMVLRVLYVHHGGYVASLYMHPGGYVASLYMHPRWV